MAVPRNELLAGPVFVSVVFVTTALCTIGLIALVVSMFVSSTFDDTRSCLHFTEAHLYFDVVTSIALTPLMLIMLVSQAMIIYGVRAHIRKNPPTETIGLLSTGMALFAVFAMQFALMVLETRTDTIVYTVQAFLDMFIGLPNLVVCAYAHPFVFSRERTRQFALLAISFYSSYWLFFRVLSLQVSRRCKQAATRSQRHTHRERERERKTRAPNHTLNLILTHTHTYIHYILYLYCTRTVHIYTHTHTV